MEFENLKKFQLCVGLNDKDTKLQKISTVEAYKIVENVIISNGLEGATIFEGRGVYKHANGRVVIETTLICELLFTDVKTVENICEQLKGSLNQESIAVSELLCNSALV